MRCSVDVTVQEPHNKCCRTRKKQEKKQKSDNQQQYFSCPLKATDFDNRCLNDEGRKLPERKKVDCSCI